MHALQLAATSDFSERADPRAEVPRADGEP
jgi:hypothetical protein